LAGANLLHLFDFDDFIGEPRKRKKKKEKEMMKMFGIRGKEEKNKINGAPPGHFQRTSYTSSPLTPEQKMRMGRGWPSQKKKKGTREKEKKDQKYLVGGKSHSGWDTLKRIIIRLMKPTRIMSGCCCSNHLAILYFSFFRCSEEEEEGKRNG
jgi:hypothetical protein